LALKSASFQCTLSFIVKEANSVDDPGYSDEYQVEDLQIFVGDYIKPTFLGNEKWNELAHQDIETYQLPLQSIDEAVTKLHQQLGMKPTLENNHHVMQGMLANHAILCRVRMVFDKENGVTMELSVKSSNEEVCSLVSNGIQ
jgi:coatomer protein complex subunit gamma